MKRRREGVARGSALDNDLATDGTIPGILHYRKSRFHCVVTWASDFPDVSGST